MAHMALSAVQPLLWLLRNEARLLSGVSGDVQFIKDEMESMKGFLLNLARANRAGDAGDYQLRALMEQVMELAYDSRNCIEDYAHSARPPGRARRGLASRFLRLAWLPKRLLVRRRVAARIRVLKVRVREIGLRQQRYAIVMPPRVADAGGGITVDWAPQAAGHRAQDRQRPSTHPDRGSARRAMLAGPDILTLAKEEVIEWLKERSSMQNNANRWLTTSVLGVITLDGVDGASLADQVYKHCSDTLDGDPLKFDYLVHIKVQRPPLLVVILLDMLRQLHPGDHFMSAMGANIVEAWDADRVTFELKKCLRGKRLLLLLSGMDYPRIWTVMVNKHLVGLQCSPRSVVVFCTGDAEVAAKWQPSPSHTKTYSLVDFCCKKAVALVPSKLDLGEDRRFHLLVKQIMGRCTPDVYCMNLFLHALLSNPYRTEQELESLFRSIDPVRCATSMGRQISVLTFCYNGLHKDYQNCLWYTTAFTRGIFKVRRASLLRRWVAEGLIKRGATSSAMAEADRCFDALFTQKLLLCREVSGTDKIKSCGLNPLFSPLITDDTTEDTFPDANQLPDDLQLHFSIRNGIQLRSMAAESAGMAAEVDSAMSPQRNTRMKQQITSMMAFLKYLPSSSSFRLLRVLELESYKGFRKRHLKNICKIHQLKYLNLRNTDIKQLPKEMDQLQLLETLDIRGTMVKELNTVLPMLKHLLAGRVVRSASQGKTIRSKESFSTVRLGHAAIEMKNLEVLSHVNVSYTGKELRGAARKLPMLRKLGVVLPGTRRGNNNMMDKVFTEVRQLNRSFDSLSIRVEPPENRATARDAVLTLPSCLKTLRICGVVDWSPNSIGGLHQLTKITLHETSLNQDALSVLGALEGLVCLRLLYHSLMEGALNFQDGQFRSLKDLVVEDDTIRRITFESGTSPMLGKMVWSFSHMNSLSGIKNLPSLRYLELNRGTYEVDGLRDLRQDIIPNHVNFILNPPEEGQREGPVDPDDISE